MKKIVSILLLLVCVSCGKSSNFNRKIYKVGVDPSFFSAELGQQQTNVYAFTTDIFAKISEKNNINIQIVNLNWDDLIYEMALGRVDTVISGAPPTLMNTNKFNFSDPLLRTGPVLIVPIDSEAFCLKCLPGKLVGIPRGNREIEIIASYPKTEFYFYDLYTTALETTLQGRSQGVLIPIIPAARYVNDLFFDALKIVTTPLTNEALRLLTPINSEKMAIEDRGTLKDPNIARRRAEIMPMFNESITEMLDNGEYHELLHKWTLSQ